MRALLYRGKGKLAFANVPKPRLTNDQALVKVRAVGICGTDLHIYNGGTAAKTGLILGHEFSGDVIAIGRHVTKVRRGDRVTAEHVLPCKTCYFCKRGKPNLCLASRVFGISENGALAEFLAIPADLVYKVPKTMPYDEAALIEPLTIALYASSEAGYLVEKKVAVIGQGPIGILLDQVLTAAGADVIGIDVQENRLRFAKKKGWAQVVINGLDRHLLKKVQRLAPYGVDAAFEAVGREATVATALNVTRRAGQVFLLGVFEKPASVDVMHIITQEQRVRGSWTCAFSFPAAIEMVHEGKVDLKSLITHRYAFKDALRAFEDSAAYKGNRIKTVITIP